MFTFVVYATLVTIMISILLYIVRIFIGPSTNDRIMGLDALGVTLVGFIGVVMILQDTIAYSDVVLVLSILSFVGTIAMTKFIERGAVLTTIEVITSFFLLVGSFFTLLSAVGIIRLRDVYSRMHAAGKTSTFGMMSFMIAVFIYFIPDGYINVKILLAIMFVFMTAPLGALMVNRSAYRNGVPLEENTLQDDLREKYKDEKLKSSE